MKKGLRHLGDQQEKNSIVFQTTDLMKKGLRRDTRRGSSAQSVSDHRPDEEGIKTPS